MPLISRIDFNHLAHFPVSFFKFSANLACSSTSRSYANPRFAAISCRASLLFISTMRAIMARVGNGGWLILSFPFPPSLHTEQPQVLFLSFLELSPNENHQAMRHHSVR